MKNIIAQKIKLVDLASRGEISDTEVVLDLFLKWVEGQGFKLFSAQEEAILELYTGKNVILNTPTGSGKSLVALALHFLDFCRGGRSYYTSPTKALASEKFFYLCEQFGASAVGMQTGDASINSEAPIICATAEVLAHLAIRKQNDLNVTSAVLDEFHYYSDRERGVAWQLPLITLPQTQFLLMSATLGNVDKIVESLEKETGKETVVVKGDERPVPLEFFYWDNLLHEAVELLRDKGMLPAYIVSFTQRECAEIAQDLSSINLATSEEKRKLRQAISAFRFDSPYGKEMKRLIEKGVAVHHAGLLPKYRLLVEQLAQQGLLKVICGTDTLGVGVNIPIRTVLFTKLAKFDGEKVRRLTVREFKQIAGRAGRKGFDNLGYVIALPPEFEVLNQRLNSKKKRKVTPPRGFVKWDKEFFSKLISSEPEKLISRFEVSHHLILNLLQRDQELNDPTKPNFYSLRVLINKSHDSEKKKKRHIRKAAVLVRSLKKAGVIELVKDTNTNYYWVVLKEGLQIEFSLHHALSLFLVEGIKQLDNSDPQYHLKVLTLVESILEDPRAILKKQERVLKDRLLKQLKAEKVPYEERVERLEEVTYPQPDADLVWDLFAWFSNKHPWVIGYSISPKGIGREMYENFFDFSSYVKYYGLQRSEGVLLRYITQLYKTLFQNVPETSKNEAIYDLESYFRTIIDTTDTSLLKEWEFMLNPELKFKSRDEQEKGRREIFLYQLLHDYRAFEAKVRNEMHQFAKALAEEDFQRALSILKIDPDDRWDLERIEQAVKPLKEIGGIVWNKDARDKNMILIKKIDNRNWEVYQNLLTPTGDTSWYILGTVDLAKIDNPYEPIVTLRYIGNY